MPTKSTQKNKKNNKGKESIHPTLPVPPEIYDKLPKEARQFLMSFSMERTPVSPVYELAKKISSKDVGQLVRAVCEAQGLEFEVHKRSQWFHLGYAVLGIVVFIFLTIFFGNKDINAYMQIIRFLFAFFAGFGSGFGAKAYFDRRR